MPAAMMACAGVDRRQSIWPTWLAGDSKRFWEFGLNPWDRHKRDQHHGHLRSGAMQLKGDQGDDREHREEIAEHAHDLRNPQPPHRAKPQDFAER
jgi:hypothetical protein